MKQKTKKIITLSLIFVVGVLIGVGGTTVWPKNSSFLKFVTEFSTLGFLVFELEDPYYQYLYSHDINTSIYALEHSIKFIEDFYNKYLSQKGLDKGVAFDLAITYVRLGNLYKRKGEDEEAMERYRKGLEIIHEGALFKEYEGTEKEIRTIDDLKRFVAKLDEMIKKEDK